MFTAAYIPLLKPPDLDHLSKEIFISLYLNPITIDLFGALWYWEGGTMCPQILKALLNLKFLSKSNQIKAERYNRV